MSMKTLALTRKVGLKMTFSRYKTRQGGKFLFLIKEEMKSISFGGGRKSEESVISFHGSFLPKPQATCEGHFPPFYAHLWQRLVALLGGLSPNFPNLFRLGIIK